MRAQTPAYFRKLGLIGITLASIGALLLIWMHGVKQESLGHESPYTQSSEEARGDVPHIQTDFRGDLIGYAKDSVALKSVRSENRVALLTLANAGAVLHRDSDFSGETPDYVKAFDSIGNDPAAMLAFRELVHNAAPAGRIYGLCGLYQKKSVSFSLARTHLAQPSQSLVWYKSSYDVFEKRYAHEIAERPEAICLKIGGSAQ